LDIFVVAIAACLVLLLRDRGRRQDKYHSFIPSPFEPELSYELVQVAFIGFNVSSSHVMCGSTEHDDIWVQSLLLDSGFVCGIIARALHV
jgi:hypothetical protein